MTVLAPIARDTLVGRINPVAKLGAAALVSLPLIATLDVVSAGVALVLVFALMPLCGLGIRQFWARTWIVWALAPLTGLTIALYGKPSGEVFFEWFLIRVSEGSLVLAAATTLRVLAIALPSVVLFVSVDATELADGLAQILRLPARFVLGALAGLRTVGLFIDDWRQLELARRARGVADRGRIRRLSSMAFGLLVLSVRRGSALATAMEARAFGAPGARSWARPSRIGRSGWVLMGVALAVAAAALAASVWAGTFHPILGPGI